VEGDAEVIREGAKERRRERNGMGNQKERDGVTDDGNCPGMARKTRASGRLSRRGSLGEQSEDFLGDGARCETRLMQLVCVVHE
jgi:hypothetical protein